MAERTALRVAFETLGCRSNYADTVDLQAAVAQQGGVPTVFDAPADVYVLNSCTVTDDADKTVLRHLRRIRADAPSARVVVTGCMAETSPERIRDVDPGVVVIGPGKRSEVLDAIFGIPCEQSEVRPRKRGGWYAEALSTPLSPMIAGPGELRGEVRSRARFHLRVQEGCENACTFCIIPFSRGGLVSRPLEQVLEDVRSLHDRGYGEIVLTGTHLGGYGEDLSSSLAALLRALAEAQIGPRIRLSSIDPNDVTPEIVEILSQSDIFCPHLHICVQAFSDSVLKRMNRRYRLSEIYEIVSCIFSRIPGCSLGSDVIAGFPGESRQDVEQAIATFLGLPFSYLHVFPYSERSGTAATRLDGVVDRAERKRRVARWRALAEERWAGFHRGLAGRTLEVVLEHGGPDAAWMAGTSREFASVVCHLADEHPAESAVGRLVNVRAESYDERNGYLICRCV